MSTTPKQGHAPITMRRVEPDIKYIERPGDYWIEQAAEDSALWHINLAAPTGTSARPYTFARLAIRRKDATHTGVYWLWNGSEEAPTLTPSLHCVGVWHGYVRDGSMIEA